MRHLLLFATTPVVVGLIFLAWMEKTKEGLKAEPGTLEEWAVQNIVDDLRGVQREVAEKISQERREYFGPTFLDRVGELSDLKREELKRLASWVLSEQTTPGGEEVGKRQQEVLALITELEPDWVLHQLENRAAGRRKSYPRYSRTIATTSFGVFLRQDRTRALQWYQDGLGDRNSEFFSEPYLARLAAAELLKSNPEQAIEVLEWAADYQSKDRFLGVVSFPEFARLENIQQRTNCISHLEQVRSISRKSLEDFVIAETYRIRGVDGLRRLFESHILLDDRQNHGIFGKLTALVNRSRSNTEMRELAGFAYEAPEEARAGLVGSLVGYWGYFDAPAAEQYIREMSPGEARQLTFDRLIQAKNEYDPDKGYELLPEITDDARRNVFRKLMDEKWGVQE